MSSQSFEDLIINLYPELKRSSMLVATETEKESMLSLVELRNAIEHIYRGVSSNTDDERHEQLAEAEAHFRRAIIDNIKLVLSARIELVEKLLSTSIGALMNEKSDYLAEYLTELNEQYNKVNSEIEFRDLKKMLNALIHQIDKRDKILKSATIAIDIGKRKKFLALILSFSSGILASLIAYSIFRIF